MIIPPVRINHHCSSNGNLLRPSGGQPIRGACGSITIPTCTTYTISPGRHLQTVYGGQLPIRGAWHTRDPGSATWVTQGACGLLRRPRRIRRKRNCPVKSCRCRWAWTVCASLRTVKPRVLQGLVAVGREVSSDGRLPPFRAIVACLQPFFSRARQAGPGTGGQAPDEMQKGPGSRLLLRPGGLSSICRTRHLPSRSSRRMGYGRHMVRGFVFFPGLWRQTEGPSTLGLQSVGLQQSPR